MAPIVCCRRRSVFVAVIRAANSKGTGSASLFSFFPRFYQVADPPTSIAGADKGIGDDIFLCPARFSRPLRNIARQLYQTRPNCDISPLPPPPATVVPLAFCYSIAPSSLFFLFPFSRHARRFFLSHMPAIYLADRSSESWL